MFKLTQNDYIKNGSCKYINNFGSTAFVKNNGNGITARLRFNRDDIKARPLYIKFPIPEDEEGKNLQLDYSNNVDLSSEDIQESIKDFGMLLNRWIDMICDIDMVDMGKNLLSEDKMQELVDNLCGYEEVGGIVNTINKNPISINGLINHQ